MSRSQAEGNLSRNGFGSWDWNVRLHISEGTWRGSWAKAAWGCCCRTSLLYAPISLLSPKQPTARPVLARLLFSSYPISSPSDVLTSPQLGLTTLFPLLQSSAQTHSSIFLDHRHALEGTSNQVPWQEGTPLRCLCLMAHVWSSGYEH